MDWNETYEYLKQIGILASIVTGVGVGVLAGTALYKYLKHRREEDAAFVEVSFNPQASTSREKVSAYNFDPVAPDGVIGLESIVSRLDMDSRLLLQYRECLGKVEVPRGVVLVGPPGSGKTLLARYFFTKTPGTVFRLNRGEFEGFGKISAAYEEARKRRDKTGKPVILFQDEIGIDYTERNTMTLLEELSGVQSERNAGIYLLGTTNKDVTRSKVTLHSMESQQSPAYRPGRLDVLFVSPPSLESKARIFSYYLSHDGVRYDEDPMEIATCVPMHETGAFVKAVVDEAKQMRFAAGAMDVPITNMDLLRALNARLMGNKLDVALTPEQKKRVAVHEIGHYLVARYLGYRAAFISAEEHMNSLGYAHLVAHESDILTLETDLERRMKIFIAGHCAEHLLYGNRSVGLLEDQRNVLTVYRYLHAIRNRQVDANFLFHYNGSALPRLDMPRQLVSDLERDVVIILRQYENGIKPASEYVVEHGTVHVSELNSFFDFADRTGK